MLRVHLLRFYFFDRRFAQQLKSESNSYECLNTCFAIHYATHLLPHSRRDNDLDGLGDGAPADLPLAVLPSDDAIRPLSRLQLLVQVGLSVLAARSKRVAVLGKETQ